MRTERSATKKQLQSKLVNIHLCGLNEKLSASSIPSKKCLYSGQIAAVPDIAASMCIQSSYFWHTFPISGSGSIAFVDVVPTVAQTKNGTSPFCKSFSIADSSKSARMANFSSTPITRRLFLPIPAIFIAFSNDEWVCSET